VNTFSGLVHTAVI